MTRVTLGIVLVVICAFVEALAQIAWKKSAHDQSRKTFWVIAGALTYVVEVVLYTFALTLIDVTSAFAMSSLSVVFVALLSRVLLGEKISAMRGYGLILVLCGVVLMGGHA